MSRLLNAKAILSSVAFLSLTAYADSENSRYFTVEGSKTTIIPIEVDLKHSQSMSDFESMAGIKTLQLLNIRPSTQLLEQNAENRAGINTAEPDYSTGVIPFSSSPGAVDLGMENVPVIDQGHYGTCVTFSSTAALDARFKLGDYIDQQCSLALDKALGSDWWDGAYTPADIFNPLIKHGFVEKGKCFGTVYANRDQEVTAEKYETISNKTYSVQIKSTYGKTVATSLDTVKAALKAGNRVLTGFFLVANSDPISVAGFNVKIDGVQKRGGLWACKQSGNTFNYCPSQDQLNAGHEVLIIGYDDKQELIKIRNSWGTSVGDKGDFYMTYAFFKSMAMDYTSVN